MSKAEVASGWVIVDQAAVIKGMTFGPGYLKGQTRSGRLGAGYHNLIGKDVVFRADGKHALREIVERMLAMDDRYIRCGIRPGMLIEKFEPSEYGGGDDQVRVEAGEDDIVRCEYYLYVFPEDRSAYSFSSLVTRYVTGLSGLAPGSVFSSAGKDLLAAIAGMFVAAKDGAKGTTDLERALRSDAVVVLLTGTRQGSRTPIATHRHTHRIATLGREVYAAVEALVAVKA